MMVSVRKRPRQTDGFRDLRVIHPRVERQAKITQAADPCAEVRATQQPGRRIRVSVTHLVARVPGAGMPDTAKSRTGCAMRFEHVANRMTQAQVREADDPGCNPRPGLTALQGRRATVHELGFADRPQPGRTVRAVLLVALNVDRARYPVAAADIGEKFLDQIAARRELPEMVVRITDLDVGVDRSLDRAREPLLPCCHDALVPT